MKINNLEITQFAPVIIPTLCRYNHFVQLIKSLSKCRYAEQTEIYIGLDYPVKREHELGHKLISEYLDGINKLNFKNVHIIKRDHNYGLGKNGNAQLLLNDVLKSFDRFIITEDDNIFAPGFLEFINYNLEYYKIDKDVLAVCGYQYPMKLHISEPHILRLEHFSAWGYGTWKDRYKQTISIREAHLADIVNDKPFIKYTLRRRPNIFTDMLGMVNGAPILGDSLYTAIQLQSGLRSIFPSRSLVRNCGWDGSGTHGGKVPLYAKQDIDKTTTIEEYKIATKSINDIANLAIYHFFRSYIPIIQHLLTGTTIGIYFITGKYCNFNYFRRLWKKLFR